MAERKERPKPHPDDFMIVTVSLEFRAKPNPKSSDPPPFDTTAAIEYALSAAEAAEYLEKVVSAIRDRRLYGFMTQRAAESHVGAGEWIKETAEDINAEAMARQEREK
ncbi:hypothetical protein QA640_18140 [Bradyrhizobium sp. CB82]|uniref:hypothetical protein n=1 Tax=Bradyrhizobium sp. CB82 TaxID=3039159 RepID=UPI0024B0CF4E|nr:hypothetical protein [Bradyrhizobium sp. CB82]WFU44195.1 hypothetical protein QA640_18140 [Bradyrhizobium sp. CB82]